MCFAKMKNERMKEGGNEKSKKSMLLPFGLQVTWIFHFSGFRYSLIFRNFASFLR